MGNSENKKIRVVMVGASLDQQGGIATVENLLLKHAPREICYTHISSHEEGSVVHRVIIFSKAWVRLFMACLSNRTDVVHIHVSDGGSILRKILCCRTAFAFRKPVLLHTHGAEFHITHEKHGRWMQNLTRATFQRCSVFAVLTKQWRDYYINKTGVGPEKIVLLQNPTELPPLVPERRNAEVVKLAFCGRIGERKGAFDLIQAFANLPVDVRNRAELIMAGDGEIERAKKLATERGIENRVQFLGWVDRDRVKTILEESHVFLLPSYNEGLPLSLLDAMGWGLPSITTPVSGIPDVVQTDINGILVNPGDIVGLTEALQVLINDEATRLRLGTQARLSVEPLEVNRFCERLSKIYESMVQPS